MNYELSELVKNADILRFIKSRIAWLGHVMRMDEKRTPKRIVKRKPKEKEEWKRITEKAKTHSGL
jgi:hypothetical protein